MLIRLLPPPLLLKMPLGMTTKAALTAVRGMTQPCGMDLPPSPRKLLLGLPLPLGMNTVTTVMGMLLAPDMLLVVKLGAGMVLPASGRMAMMDRVIWVMDKLLPLGVEMGMRSLLALLPRPPGMPFFRDVVIAIVMGMLLGLVIYWMFLLILLLGWVPLLAWRMPLGCVLQTRGTPMMLCLRSGSTGIPSTS